jgi:hypothetical protein
MDWTLWQVLEARRRLHWLASEMQMGLAVVDIQQLAELEELIWLRKVAVDEQLLEAPRYVRRA